MRLRKTRTQKLIESLERIIERDLAGSVDQPGWLTRNHRNYYRVVTYNINNDEITIVLRPESTFFEQYDHVEGGPK